MTNKKFYVYAHYRLDTMEPFYIGKGSGERAYDLKRNKIHDAISAKYGHAVVILADNLTEKQAFKYEKKAIETLVYEYNYSINAGNIRIDKEDHKWKMSFLTNFSFGGEGNSGCQITQETRQKLSAKKKGKYGTCSSAAKQVYCYELKMKFSYMLQAFYFCKNILNIEVKNITGACKGSISYCGIYNGNRLHWKYIEEVEPELLEQAEICTYEESEEERSIRINHEKKPKEKQIFCPELNKIFSSIKQAGMYCKNILKTSTSNICGVCKNKADYSGTNNGKHLTWKYIEDVEPELLEKAEICTYEESEEEKNNRINHKKQSFEKQVYCYELKMKFLSMQQAIYFCKNVLNIKIGRISLVCRNIRNYTGIYNGNKLHWKYIEDVDPELLEQAKICTYEESEEEKNNRINRQKQPFGKQIYCYELKMKFLSIQQAKLYCKNILNIKIGPIGDVCRNVRNYTGIYNGSKLHWKYIEEVEPELLEQAEICTYEESEEERSIKINHEKKPQEKQVYCYELKMKFLSIRQAFYFCKNVLNIKIGKINTVCKNKKNCTGVYNGNKLHWKYIEEVEPELLEQAEICTYKK